ncbi:hypothetical protein AWV80_01330 [Cupriavidus sp. UYMU48A]|nr:hypothetical protein AWV80_01330 [Cupriavidus sp. UYMU48A]
MTTVKERPILFSGAMVRAILEGEKSQTRRVLKQATGPSLSVGIEEEPGVAELSWLYGDGPGHDVHERIKRVACPYGKPGDRLWVRETWSQPTTLDPGPTVYRADYPACVPPGFENIPPAESITWKPSIHMPRSLSRIRLEVTDVRVEKLQSMSQNDLWSEGIGELLEDPNSAPGRAFNEAEHYMIGGAPMKHIPEMYGFAALWDSLNGAGAWDANPWVWVVEFRRAS